MENVEQNVQVDEVIFSFILEIIIYCVLRQLAIRHVQVERQWSILSLRRIGMLPWS